jgi:hypothetical protein
MCSYIIRQTLFIFISFMVIFSGGGDKIEKNEMGGACIADGVGERRA